MGFPGDICARFTRDVSNDARGLLPAKGGLGFVIGRPAGLDVSLLVHKIRS
jgi:hypothetical protein